MRAEVSARQAGLARQKSAASTVARTVMRRSRAGSWMSPSRDTIPAAFTPLVRSTVVIATGRIPW
jgi:hypothetical protein